VVAVPEPLISVIIPTFRRPDLLSRAIASVLSQTYTHWEILVVDDNNPGSAARGETEAVMAAYRSDQRIHHLKHESNQGLPTARNTAIRVARGSLVAFLDDDDEWLPAKLERQVEAFAADETVTLVYTGRRAVDTDGRLVRLFPADPNGLIRDCLLEENWIGTPSSVMCRREALVAAGMFDPNMPSLEDWDMYLRLGGRFARVPEPLTVYYMHDGGRMMDDYKTVAKAMGLIYRKNRRELRARRAAHAGFLGHHGHVLYHAGERRRAQQLMLRSLALDPFKRRTVRHLMKATFSEERMDRLRRRTAPLRSFLRRSKPRAPASRDR
jgi:glycosyltransferase involved in cell wall biosynthesis